MIKGWQLLLRSTIVLIKVFVCIFSTEFLTKESKYRMVC